MTSRCTTTACGSALALALLAAAALAAPASAQANWTSGVATLTGAPDGDDLTGVAKPASLPDAACGFGEMKGSLYPGFALAGISFKASPLAQRAQRGCGTCVELRCTSDACANSKGPLIVTIYDECTDCEANQLNLEAWAFNTLAPLDVGRVPIQWRQVPCPARGGIVVNVDAFRTSGGGWLRLSLKNVAGEGGLTSVQLSKAGAANWLTMKNAFGGAWEMSKLPDSPSYDLLLTDRAGRRVTLKGAVKRGIVGETQAAENFKA